MALRPGCEGGITAIAEDPTRPDVAIPALDGFRALAIVIVLASHIGLERVFPGQFGVTLFFFLSGYLITTLLRREALRDGQIDLRAFYRRRFVRILPPLYITLAFFLLLSGVGLLHPINASWLWADILFVSNYLPFSGMPIGLWSLAVEEHFYLGFPLLLALLLRRRFSFAGCAAVCLGLCGIVLAARLWEVRHTAVLNDMTFWTHTRIDSILFGCVLALWNNPVADRGNVLPRGGTGYALAVALLLPTFAIRDEAFRQSYRYTVQGFGLIVLFNTAIRDRVLAPALLDHPVVRQIALYSYTLYLVHSGLIMMVTRPDGSHPLLPTAAALAGAWVYAVLMHRWVEKPMSRWRRARELAARERRATAELITERSVSR